MAVGSGELSDGIRGRACWREGRRSQTTLRDSSAKRHTESSLFASPSALSPFTLGRRQRGSSIALSRWTHKTVKASAASRNYRHGHCLRLGQNLVMGSELRHSHALIIDIYNMNIGTCNLNLYSLIHLTLEDLQHFHLKSD